MSEPVRVLVLDTVMDRGGAETMTMNYLRRMDRSKVQYDFLVNRDYKAAYEDEIAELGGKVYRMCPLYPQYFDKYKRQFRGFLKVHPEYRIIHSNLEERSYFALRIAKEMGVPVRIAHAHNRPVGFDLKSVVREYFRFRLPPYATHYFACGQEAGDWLFGVKNRSKVIQERNAVDTALYRYDPTVAEEVRAEFQNQVKSKVHELGLDESVVFTGVRTDVNRLMQGMDLFILPSLFEGFPMTMIEAQSAGLPCMISDKVPPQCDVTGNVQIMTLDSTPEEWAKHILDQSDKYAAKSDRADGAKSVTKAGYDIVKNAEWLRDFYVNALAKAEARERR